MKYLAQCYTPYFISVSLLYMTGAQSDLLPFGDCDKSSHCVLEELNENVICEATPFGYIEPACYGHWSSFSSCNCSDPNYRISSSGSTYWCEEDGHFDSKLYDVECFAPCTTDAGTKAVSKNSDGVITSTIKDGDYVIYSCPDGYTSSGDTIVACKDGMWNKHNTFECHGNCTAPENYKFVDTPNSNMVAEGTVVNMRCKDGYLPSDTIVRTCKNETFEDVPKCHAEFSCESLSLTDDSVIVTPDQTNYPEDTTVLFSCPAGFELHGDSSATCHKGEWLFSIEPTCVVSCSPSCSWSSWCDDEPPGTKFIAKDETEDVNSCAETICDNPVNIECVTVFEGTPHYALPGVTCDLSTGLHCDVTAMGICSNFQIRYECCITCQPKEISKHILYPDDFLEDEVLHYNGSFMKAATNFWNLQMTTFCKTPF